MPVWVDVARSERGLIWHVLGMVIRVGVRHGPHPKSTTGRMHRIIVLGNVNNVESAYQYSKYHLEEVGLLTRLMTWWPAAQCSAG